MAIFDSSAPPRLPLRDLCEGERFERLDKLEAYYRGTCYDGRAYDWDGCFRGYGNDAPIAPGWYVPLAHRRPSARYDLGKVVTRALTSFVFGEGRHPTVDVAGDLEAEDFVRELVRESKLFVRMAEARNLGGAEGTAVLSWCVRDGRPRVSVQNAKHCKVLAWADEDELRPAAVLRAYSYEEPVYDPASKTTKRKTFWCVRFWNEQIERVYEPIPDDVAKEPFWPSWPSTETVHGFGFCPVYWIQNQPNAEDYDGDSDFEGALDLIDELNAVLSQATRGTKANTDPTLVVREDPVKMAQINKSGTLRKGSGAVIYATGGADYLELSGTAVESALATVKDLETRVLAICGVLRPDPEKLSGAAQSGKALEILYAPMLAVCSILRDQYADQGILPILRDMLRVARRWATSEPTLDPEGNPYRVGFTLDPRVEALPAGDTPGDVPVFVELERRPGTSEALSLTWPAYFAPTWADKSAAITAAKAANGDKPVLSQRTSIEVVGPMLGVVDVDEELERIHEDQEEALKRAREAMGGSPFATGLPFEPSRAPAKPDPDPDDPDPDDES